MSQFIVKEGTLSLSSLLEQINCNWKKYYLIYFSRTKECPFCTKTKEHVQEISKKYASKIICLECSIDHEQNKNLAKALGIKILPSLILIKYNQPDLIMGYKDILYLLSYFNKIEEYCVNCFHRKNLKDKSIYCKKIKQKMNFLDNCEDFK